MQSFLPKTSHTAMYVFMTLVVIARVFGKDKALERARILKRLERFVNRLG
jgi:hypothetical protein